MDASLSVANWGVTVLLISLRLGAALVSTPIFSNFPVPKISKVCFIASLSLVLATQIPNNQPLPLGAAALLVAAISETAIGLTLALGVRATFSALELAGRLVEAQSGLSMASFFNPATTQRDSIIGAALTMAGLIFFMAINGHHGLLRSFSATLQITPLASGWHANWIQVTAYFGKTYLFGFVIGASASLALWLIDLALGVMVRSMPQFNILFLSFPLKLLLILVLLALLIPHLGSALLTLFQMQDDYWQSVMVSHV